MSFSTHTFETNPQGHLGFAFHENIGEGQTLYFLGKFDPATKNADIVAETIFGEIVDYFEQTPQEKAYSKFENALKKANLATKKLSPALTNRPEIIIGFFDFHHLYLSQSGEAEAYLIREAEISQITEQPHDEDELFINILSGNISVGDIIVFSSHRILKSLTSSQLVDILSQENFSTAISDLRHQLSTKSEIDTLVTTIGIGKKSGVLGSAGFLSKVVNSGKNITDNAKSSLSQPQESPEKNPEILDEVTTQDKTTNEEELSQPVSPLPQEEAGKGMKIPQITLPKIPKINLPQIRNENKAKIIGLLLLIIILILGVTFISNFESEEESVLREQLSIAKEAIQQADTFLLQGEREEAKEYLSKAETSAQKILGTNNKLFRSDAQFLLADIQEKKLRVENASTVTPNLVADLGVKHDNFIGMGLNPLQGSLFVNDTKKLVKTIRNVIEKGINITDSTILASTVRTDQNTILFLTDNPRIVEYKNGLVTPMRTTDDNWKTGLDIKTYGRYAYILDPVENQIWKYTRQRANYSGATPYNQGADLSRAVSFAIDGAVYVLSDDGTIQKIFRGKKVSHSFRNLPSIPFQGKNLKIYTSAELDFIYILDPDNERVLVFTKGENFATYKKQIIFNAENAQDFRIETSGQKAQILTNDKIYEIPL